MLVKQWVVRIRSAGAQDGVTRIFREPQDRITSPGGPSPQGWVPAARGVGPGTLTDQGPGRILAEVPAAGDPRP